MINRLLTCSPLQIWLYTIAASIGLGEAINAVMELLVAGEVTLEAQLIGLVTSFIVSAIVASVLISKASARFHLQSEITENAGARVMTTRP